MYSSLNLFAYFGSLWAIDEMLCEDKLFLKQLKIPSCKNVFLVV